MTVDLAVFQVELGCLVETAFLVLQVKREIPVRSEKEAFQAFEGLQVQAETGEILVFPDLMDTQDQKECLEVLV